MSEPRWLTSREAEIWATYRRLCRDLQRAQGRQLQQDSGISAADYALLAPLSETEGGVLRARELGAEVDWERSRLSHQINRMEKRGLIVREACEDDARGLMVRLTEKGRETIEAAAPGHVEIVRQLFFDPLGAGEMKTLGEFLGRIAAAVEGNAEGRA